MTWYYFDAGERPQLGISSVASMPERKRDAVAEALEPKQP